MSKKEESSLLSPADIKKREIEASMKKRKRKPIQKELIISDDEVEVNEKGEVVVPIVDDNTSDKLQNRAGMVCVNFETQGRFDMPEKLYFKDFDVKDVNDLTLSRQEDILENLIVVLNRLKNQDNDIDLQNTTLEEFMEILISIKSQFESVEHEHPWLCECQDGIPENEKIVNTEIINLSELNYSSIEDVEENIKQFYRDSFADFTDEDYKAYIKSKYQDSKIVENWSIEKEIETVKIKEPFNVPIENDIYAFRFMRVKDLINGFKMARKEYGSKFKKVQNEQRHNVPLAELKEMKKEKIAKLQDEETKAGVLYSKALTLVSINDEELNDKEKIEKYKKMPRTVLFEIVRFLDRINFGVNDERDLICPLCGESNRRSLQQEFNPIEFVPFDVDQKGKSKLRPGTNIYFGL